MNLRTILICTLAVVVHTAVRNDASAKPFNRLDEEKIVGMVPDSPKESVYTEESGKTKFEAMKKQPKRSPASLDDIGDSEMSKELKDLRNELAVIETPEKLDELIEKYGGAGYANLKENDTRWVAIQLGLYKGWKSFLFRVRKFVENQDARAIHAMILTGMRGAFSAERVGYPNQEWKVGAEYAAMPMADTVNRVITNELEFKAWLKEWNSIYETAEARLNALNLTKPIVWDNQFFYAGGSFQEGLRRYQWITNLEVQGMLSSVYLAHANLYMMLAYSWEDVLKVGRSLGYAYGFDVIKVWKDVQGAPASERTKQVRGHYYFGRLSVNNKGEKKYGQEYMQKAWTKIVQSIKVIIDVWGTFKEPLKGEPSFVNMKYWQMEPNFTQDDNNYKVTDTNIKILKQFIEGKDVNLVSSVTNDRAHFNLFKFFNNPPDDLKHFMPIGFHDEKYKGSQKLKCTTPECNRPVNGKSVPVRNWEYGRPLQWSVSAYKPYFSDMTQAEDGARIIRVLSQSPGSGYLSWFFAFVGM